MATNNLYPGTSPYQSTGIVNGKFLDIMVNRPIPMLQTDVYWTITPVYQYRPDLLAFDLYGDAGLWWVFAVRNPDVLLDPVFDFIAPTIIYVPTLNVVKTALGL